MNKTIWIVALLLVAMLLIHRTYAQEDTEDPAVDVPEDDTAADDEDDSGNFSNWVNETEWLCGGESCSCNDYYASALLLGANEVPAVLELPDAWGSAIVRLIQAESNGTNSTVDDGTGIDASNGTSGSWVLQFSVFVQGLSNISVAHIHLGKACEVGDPILTLFPFGDASQAGAPFAGDGLLVTGQVSDSEWSAENEGNLLDMWSELIKGMLYVNVHTADYPDGALRGQLLAAKK